MADDAVRALKLQKRARWALIAVVLAGVICGHQYLTGIVEEERRVVQELAQLLKCHIWVGRSTGLSGYEQVDYLAIDAVPRERAEDAARCLVRLKRDSIMLWIRDGLTAEVREVLERHGPPDVSFAADFSGGFVHVKWSLVGPR